MFRRSFGFSREVNEEEEEDDGGFPAVSVIRCVWEWLENSRKVHLIAQWGALKHTGIRLKGVKRDLNL